MSMWSRITNIFRGDRLNQEIEEELQSHIDEAIEQGRNPAEARAAFGSVMRQREETRDVRIIVWLESLRADAVFGWRQIWKRKVTSAAAILSLGLAIGACVSAYRLIDALLLRPLPVKEPAQLYLLSRRATGADGKSGGFDEWAYPDFQLMRAAVKDQAELIAISEAERTDLTYKSDEEMEKAYVQYVSGWMFDSFGLRPSKGRLLTENDDVKPGKHPYAVISNDYWTRRFGRDANILSQTFRLGQTVFEIVGVVDGPFTGTQPGTVTDVFVPTMMHPGVTHDDWTWHRTLARVKPGVAVEPLRAKLDATSRAFEAERAKAWATVMTKEAIATFLAQTVLLEPAAAGASGLQQNCRRSLLALGVLVAMVLLIACANVANLMTAQAAARGREMALRVSIGAGRFRLMQMVLVEGVLIALFSATAGAWFAWWSAPFVVRMINPPDNPARLALPADGNVLAFGLMLTLVVALLFGLAPALRASGVKPASALKGGDNPHSRRRLMHGLIAVQVAFCFLVLFVAGLFAATFDKLSHRPVGFSADRLVTLDTVTSRPQTEVAWEQVAQHLRELPGIESVALAGWPLLSNHSWNNFVSIAGMTPQPVETYFLSVSPGWIDTMKIRFIDGRDFLRTEVYPTSAIVNETFAKQYYNGEDPVGKTFEDVRDEGKRNRFHIVGLVRDSPYRNLREPILPVAFVPFAMVDESGAARTIRSGFFIVRTQTSNPMALASLLRQEVRRAHPAFRVSTVRTQKEINDSHTLRERLLATLALFFAGVSLLLAGIGLYGVLDYSVLQRRREIGIRIAIGARAGGVARLVTMDVLGMMLLGAAIGIGTGLASVRYVETLFYQVKGTDLGMLFLPAFTLFGVALIAALPAVLRAVRIDPVKALRAE